MDKEISIYDFDKKLKKWAEICKKNNSFDLSLYQKYDVKRGLRDLQGRGVLTGLTDISEVTSKKIENGKEIPIDGILRYRGYAIEELIKGQYGKQHFGFEEIAYLLLFGELPDEKEFKEFLRIFANFRTLPNNFVRDIIMKAPSKDLMNTLARSVLTLYVYDEEPENTQIENVLRQCLELIALFPMLSVYSYQTYKYYYENESFFIHQPRPDFSTAENILYMLRSDSKFSELEARVLDLCLILHAEHGGGNNSTFTTRVVTSSGTDTYSAISAAIGSLKGPKHGGANIRVTNMFEEIKKEVKDWKDKDEIAAYLQKILNKEAFDKSGLIYGMGHAIYTKSDPRAVILKEFVRDLSKEKGISDEFNLYANIEEIAANLISKNRKIYKGVSANVDFYSGFAYSMLGLPKELYTPLFAIARITGWSAHRLEELTTASKIIRPAYMAIQGPRKYVELKNR